MGIQYYGLAKDEKPPSEFCTIRHENCEPCDYRFYVPERTCKPHGEWERVSQTQEVRHLVCDCGEELGMEERGTLPWRYHHMASLPNYCPECGARIEVEK
jgi:hypothetical protein